MSASEGTLLFGGVSFCFLRGLKEATEHSDLTLPGRLHLLQSG